jgi:hypothetical protein
MTTTDSLKTLIDKSKDYLETKMELTKLKTIDKSADVLSSVLVMVSIIFIASLVIFFISVAFALLLGRMVGSNYIGFFIVGGFYGLLLAIIYVQREKWIKTPVANGLINKMLK